MFSSEVRSLRRVFNRETWEAAESSDERETVVPAEMGEVWVDDSREMSGGVMTSSCLGLSWICGFGGAGNGTGTGTGGTGGIAGLSMGEFGGGGVDRRGMGVGAGIWGVEVLKSNAE